MTSSRYGVVEHKKGDVKTRCDVVECTFLRKVTSSRYGVVEHKEGDIK